MTKYEMCIKIAELEREIDNLKTRVYQLKTLNFSLAYSVTKPIGGSTREKE